MLESNEINWSAYQFEGRNELWDEVIRTLESFEEAEVAQATDVHAGGLREYYCGKAAALSEVKSHLRSCREMALSRKI